MAYADYIRAQHAGIDDAPHEVLIEQDGFGGSVTELLASGSEGPPPYTLQSGSRSDDVLRALRSNQLTARLISQEAAELATIKGIQSERSRDFRLGAGRGGSAVFSGFCQTDFIGVGLVRGAAQVCTVNAKDRLKALTQPWLDANGDPFEIPFDETRIPLSEVVAGILQHTGTPLPLRCVMAWRPSGMTETDDPLSLLMPAAPFYEADEDGYLVATERVDVLTEILELFQMQLVQCRRAGDALAWHLVQPAAFRDAGVGGSVREFQYDSAGVFQQSVERPAAVDYSGVWWREGSDEGRGRPAVREARASYFYGEGTGPLTRAFPNGGFDLWHDPDADGHYVPQHWTIDPFIGDVEIEKGGGHDYPYNAWLNLVPVEYQPDLPGHGESDEFFLDYWVENGVSVIQNEQGPTLSFLADAYITQADGTQTVVLDEYRVYYRIAVTDGASTYYYDQATDAWADNTSGAVSEFDQLVSRTVNPSTAGAPVLVSLELPPIPVTGTLTLRLYNAIAEKDHLVFPGDPYTLVGFHDNVQISFPEAPDEQDPNPSGARTITYIEFDGFVEEGEEVERTFTIGDGPVPGSPGALYKPDLAQGDPTPTGSWTARPSDDETFVVTRLWAREQMRLKRRGQPTMRFTSLTGPDGPTTGGERQAGAPPEQVTAIQYGGALWWPVAVSYDGGYGEVEIFAARLDDYGPPADSDEILRRKSAPEGGSGGGVFIVREEDRYVEAAYRETNTGDILLIRSDGSFQRVPADRIEVALSASAVTVGGQALDVETLRFDF